MDIDSQFKRLPALPVELTLVQIPRFVSEVSDIQKKTLSACSLTCRHWATILRPLIFESLTLRSPEDLTFLVRLLNFSTWKFAQFIFSMELVETSPLWIHRAFMSLPHRLPKLSMLKLRTSLPAYTQLSLRPCSYSARLFSSSSRFRSVEELHLHGFAFKYFAEFTSFVSSFPALQRLSLKGPTSVPPSNSDSHIPRVRLDHPLTEVTAVDCRLSPMMWLFLAPPIKQVTNLRDSPPPTMSRRYSLYLGNKKGQPPILAEVIAK